jgi:HSP20 family protein
MAVTRFPMVTTDPVGALVEELFRPLARGGNRGAGLLRTPDADVVETEGEILVVLDLPGIAVEDVELSLENNVLTITGERQAEWEREDGSRRGSWHLSERRYGRFSRSFVLPRDVDADRIQARMESGVLRLTIPKSEKARRRRIEIQGGGSGGSGASREVGVGRKAKRSE